MIELNKKVFGNITTKEIIGAEPPITPDMKDIFEKEFVTLLSKLELQSNDNLTKLMEEQTIAQTHVNSRPGAMALAQNKIKLFNEYNQKYVKIIKEKLKA